MSQLDPIPPPGMSSHDPPLDDLDVDTDVDDDTLNVDTVIYSFLDAFPEPTDEQVHKLAELLGFSKDDFEEKVFELFGDTVEDEFGDDDGEDGDDEEEGDLEIDGEIIEDPVDIFLISFFLLNPEPTEEQVHALADLAGVTPEHLEEHIYHMLASMANEVPDQLDEFDQVDQTERGVSHP